MHVFLFPLSVHQDAVNLHKQTSEQILNFSWYSYKQIMGLGLSNANVAQTWTHANFRNAPASENTMHTTGEGEYHDTLFAGCLYCLFAGTSWHSWCPPPPLHPSFVSCESFWSVYTYLVFALSFRFPWELSGVGHVWMKLSNILNLSATCRSGDSVWFPFSFFNTAPYSVKHLTMVLSRHKWSAMQKWEKTIQTSLSTLQSSICFSSGTSRWAVHRQALRNCL